MRHHRPKFHGLRIVLVLLPLLATTSVRPEPPDMRIRKKLIATGWDQPDSQRLLARLAEMEKRPFDGVVLEASGGYERRLLERLAEEELPVALVNPRNVRSASSGIE